MVVEIIHGFWWQLFIFCLRHLIYDIQTIRFFGLHKSMHLVMCSQSICGVSQPLAFNSKQIVRRYRWHIFKSTTCGLHSPCSAHIFACNIIISVVIIFVVGICDIGKKASHCRWLFIRSAFYRFYLYLFFLRSLESKIL